ncbi:MAG: hypothetical protein QOJ35_1972, partial [Solirubrobacteraceae bacterium]|nr:hypothetical protein [Solirubrobacteraceae bacterium]
MRLTCVLTVAALTTRACAISAFDSPAAMSFSTSASRGVNSSGSLAWSAPVSGRTGEDRGHEPLLDRRIEMGLTGDERPDRVLDLLGARVLGQVAARARLQRSEQVVVV